MLQILKWTTKMSSYNGLHISVSTSLLIRAVSIYIMYSSALCTCPHLYLQAQVVQWGIFLMVVVMKINRKKVVPSIRGGLRASCCGECHEVQVRTGTECPGVHYVFGYWCLNGRRFALIRYISENNANISISYYPSQITLIYSKEHNFYYHSHNQDQAIT